MNAPGILSFHNWVNEYVAKKWRRIFVSCLEFVIDDRASFRRYCVSIGFVVAGEFTDDACCQPITSVDRQWIQSAELYMKKAIALQCATLTRVALILSNLIRKKTRRFLVPALRANCRDGLACVATSKTKRRRGNTNCRHRMQHDLSDGMVKQRPLIKKYATTVI